MAPARQGGAAAVASHPGGDVWLFGSLARGDWDAYSDVDLLAIAPSQAAADALADDLLAARLGMTYWPSPAGAGSSSRPAMTPTGVPSAAMSCASIGHVPPG